MDVQTCEQDNPLKCEVNNILGNVLFITKCEWKYYSFKFVGVFFLLSRLDIIMLHPKLKGPS